MTATTDNPYQSPQTTTADATPLGKPTEVSWKAIAKRWEILRIPFNLMVGLTGLLALALAPIPVWEAVVGVIVYAFCANVMYLLGPVTEMYLNWFVDAWEGRLVPRWAARFVRSGYLTALLFVVGCLFSVGLTLAIGAAHAFAVALQEQ